MSVALRSSEIFSGYIGPVTELAQHCMKTRNTAKVIAEFGFENHPLVVERYDQAILKNKYKSRAVGHKDIRSIFYRSDAASMYNRLDEFRKTIKRDHDKVAAGLEAIRDDPLSLVDHDDEASVENAFKCRYMLQHFKALHLTQDSALS